MGHPTKRQAMIKAAREGDPSVRVHIPQVTCGRCAQEGIYALPSGEPRPHLRPAVQGDPGWSELVPVRVNCAEE